ncbi:MAG: hypothetical protein AMJ55_02980 [Gammaproteobacteria bacterium SG8_15]|nr:MAG: hypothetical protein AMJ55_02980 [Gammaproteobacteria bacterium SG8_15]
MDPMLVEWMQSSVSLGLEEKIKKEQSERLELLMNSLRKGETDKALYHQGVGDGCGLALSIIDSIRNYKPEENDGTV